MGFAKERAQEQWEAGFSAPYGGAVCADCIADPALKEFVREEASSDECSFCGQTADEDIAADTDEVLLFIGTRLQTEWSDANNELYRDPEEESGFAGPVWDIRDVLGEEGDVFACEAFEEFVLIAFAETQFCPREVYANTERDALQYGWSDLVETVKHEERFFFFLEENDRSGDGEGWPVPRGGELMEELGRLVEEHGLIRELGVEVELFRVRLDGADAPYETAKSLGAPPKTRARQSRMSPAGIPMLYLADDADMAVAETLAAEPDPPDGLTVGRFALVEPVLVVDLTALAPVPSIFEDVPETTALRRQLSFLHAFRRDVGGPVEHDGREHIDYVATQVVSEYLRHRFRTSDGRPVHGLAWESTRRPGGTSRVLFVGPGQCVEAGERPAFVEGPLVELRGHERRTTSTGG